MPQDDQSKRNWSRVFHWTFTLFLLFCLFSLLLTERSNTLKLAFAFGTTNYYMDILDKTEKPGFDMQQIADHMVYAYCMKKPNGIPKNLYNEFSNRNEYMAMLAITQRLAKESGKDFGSDFDAWVEHFASEESKQAYQSSKSCRIEIGAAENPLDPHNFQPFRFIKP